MTKKKNKDKLKPEDFINRDLPPVPKPPKSRLLKEGVGYVDEDGKVLTKAKKSGKKEDLLTKIPPCPGVALTLSEKDLKADEEATDNILTYKSGGQTFAIPVVPSNESLNLGDYKPMKIIEFTETDKIADTVNLAKGHSLDSVVIDKEIKEKAEKIIKKTKPRKKSIKVEKEVISDVAKKPIGLSRGVQDMKNSLNLFPPIKKMTLQQKIKSFIQGFFS